MAGPWYIVVNGSEIDIDATYGTYTTGMFGFGMPPVAHNALEQAQLPGGLFQNMKVRPRVLQLKIMCKGATLAAYHAIRKLLVAAVRPNVGGELTPVEIRYDGSGTKYFCTGYYDGGLDGSRDAGNPTPETLMLRFICYDPYWYALTATNVELATQSTITDANYVVRRIDGTWQNISTQFNATVYAFAKDSEGNIYIGGTFFNVGDASGDYIVKWAPTTELLSSLSTGLDNSVFDIVAAPQGGVYVGGSFTNAGDASGDKVAYWSGSAWASLGSGITDGSGYVTSLAMGHDGTLYVGGTFQDQQDAAGDYVSSWDGSAWASLGTGMNAYVTDLVIAPNGDLYAAGNFTTAGGVAAKKIAVWNGTTWAAVGSAVGPAGGTAVIQALAFGPDGTLYAGGSFTSIDGVSAANVAAWNGSSWRALGAGLNGTVNVLRVTDDGELYASGEFTSAGSLATADRLAVWNGTTWTPLAIDLPLTYGGQGLYVDGDDLYIGYTGSGTATASEAGTTVTNSGTAPVYPVITITRAAGTEARIIYLKNQTTGHVLYFNYALLDGETLTIDLTPGAKSITSDYFGNVIGRALLPNSDFSTWCLQPGANTVCPYVYQAGGPTVTAEMTFTAASWSAD